MVQHISPQRKVGLDIKAHRQAYKMSQSELARRTGTTQAAISRLEQGVGNPRLLTLDGIALAFGQRISVEFCRRK